MRELVEAISISHNTVISILQIGKNYEKAISKMGAAFALCGP